MKFHKYQNKAIEFTLDTPTCALWIDMGLGKTVISLSAVNILLNQFEINRVLIVAPLRVALTTWPEEIKKWSHLQDLGFTIIRGTVKQRKALLNRKTDIHIINREMIPWLVKNNEWKYDTIIIDEASNFKSHKTKRFKSLKKILHNVDRVIELTGTPTGNSLLDLWSQIYLLDKGERLGRTFTGFRDRYFTSDYNGWKWEPKPGAEEEIYAKLKDICLRLSAEDYLKMPDKSLHTIHIDIDVREFKRYKKLERDFIIQIQNESISAANSAVLSNKLRQFCNGAMYCEDSKKRVVVHDEKLNALESIIE